MREAQAINLQVLFKRNERLNKKIMTHTPPLGRKGLKPNLPRSVP